MVRFLRLTVACSFMDLYIPAEALFTAGSQEQLAQEIVLSDTTSTEKTLLEQQQHTRDGPASGSHEDEPVTKLGTSSEAYSCMHSPLYIP